MSYEFAKRVLPLIPSRGEQQNNIPLWRGQGEEKNTNNSKSKIQN
jgi:hypothetical protein